MRVLVTGGTGYIGSRLIKALENSNKCSRINAVVRKGNKTLHTLLPTKIKVFDYDGTPESLDDAVRESDLIIHLGALYDPKNTNESIELLIDSNIKFSVHLFQSIANNNPQAGVVAASTFSMFDRDHKYDPRTFYDASKFAVEVLARAFPIKIAFLRFPDTYGPDDNRKKVHNLLKNAVLNNDTCFDFQKPEYQMMNMIHVKDVIVATVIAAEMMREEKKPRVTEFDLFYPENLLSLNELAMIITKGSNTCVTFPLFGETTPIPDQKGILPNFEVKYSVLESLHHALFEEDK